MHPGAALFGTMLGATLGLCACAVFERAAKDPAAAVAEARKGAAGAERALSAACAELAHAEAAGDVPAGPVRADADAFCAAVAAARGE